MEINFIRRTLFYCIAPMHVVRGCARFGTTEVVPTSNEARQDIGCAGAVSIGIRQWICANSVL